MKCASDTIGGSQGQTGTNVYSFNDCFYICSNNLIVPAGTTCTAFTYSGGPNGQGGGTCYLKTDAVQRFNVDGNVNKVAAIRRANYGAFTTTTSAGPTSTTSTSTSSLSTSAYATPSANCPQDDGRAITDGAGVEYFLKCSSDTNGGGQYSSGTGVYSFNDCFYMCSNNTGLAGGTCTSFTYAGGENGVGGGTCYLKTETNAYFNPNTNNRNVAGIKRAFYAAFTTTTTSTTVSIPHLCSRWR